MNRSISAILKQQAKVQGLTQQKVASSLNVSVPTVKRWFSGKGLNLENLESLLQILGLSLQDLAALLPECQAKIFEYSPEQEEVFANRPEYLAYFDRLIAGDTPKKIARECHLLPKSTARYLRTLERLGLIDRLPGDRIRILARGEPKWRSNGVLAKKLKQETINQFLGQIGLNRLRMGIHRISADDVKKIEDMISELQKFARIAENRAKILEHGKQTVGLLVACSPFRWEILGTISNL